MKSPLRALAGFGASPAAVTAFAADTDSWKPMLTPMRPRTHKGDQSRCFPSEFRSKPPAWTPADWTLHGSKEQMLPMLWTEQSFGDAEFIIDTKLPDEAGKSAFVPSLALRSPKASPIPIAGPTGSWQRRVVKISQGTVKVFDGTGKLLSESPLPAESPERGPLGLVSGGGYETEFANIFVREAK